MNIIENAKRIATLAHAGQTRRDGIAPYISHPATVAYILKNQSDEVVATAWLHDVLEDTSESEGSLEAQGVPEQVIDAVVALTKGNEDYDEYLARVRANPIAATVKVADMLANLGDAPTDNQKAKYLKGLKLLLL